jgi:uncharacterized membrane protein
MLGVIFAGVAPHRNPAGLDQLIDGRLCSDVGTDGREERLVPRHSEDFGGGGSEQSRSAWVFASLVQRGKVEARVAAQRPNGNVVGAQRPPIVPPPQPTGLSSVLERNIQALSERRKREEEHATAQEKLAEAITRFTGSMLFVYIHLAIFGFWIIANLDLIPGLPTWDESFVILAMWASVEAIFLSTFVLISQNRMQAAADRRADLDLQISLLAEHEVTKLVTLVSAMAQRMGVRTHIDGEVDEITKDVAPEAVLDEIEASQHKPN